MIKAGVPMLRKLSLESQKLIRDLSGVSGSEYAIIGSGIAIAGIASVALLGDQLGLTFGDVAETISPDNPEPQAEASPSEGAGGSSGVGTTSGSGGSGGC